MTLSLIEAKPTRLTQSTPEGGRRRILDLVNAVESALASPLTHVTLLWPDPTQSGTPAAAALVLLARGLAQRGATCEVLDVPDDVLSAVEMYQIAPLLSSSGMTLIAANDPSDA